MQLEKVSVAVNAHYNALGLVDITTEMCRWYDLQGVMGISKKFSFFH